MTAHRLALASANVSSASIEAQEFPQMAQAYAVSAVPKIVINDRLEVLGAVPEEVFLDAIRQALGVSGDRPEGATNGATDGSQAAGASAKPGGAGGGPPGLILP